MDGVVQMTVTGVRVELPSNTPIVLLREQAGTRYLPIWIGAVEAMAITSALEGVTPPRPQTHDLMASVIESLGAEIQRVVVTHFRNNIYFAQLILDSNGTEVTVSSRPSDAIALSVRTGAPVFASRDVLDEASIEFQDEDAPAEEITETLEQFREMLQDVTIEDFIDEDESGNEPT